MKTQHTINRDNLKYLLVAQDRVHIEHWRKQPDGAWLVGDVEGLHATLARQSLDVRLPLAEVYKRVVFAPESET